MKIGMVTAVYKPVVNGVTHMVSLYKKYLEACGHEVTIFTLGDPDPAGEDPGVVRSPAFQISGGYSLSMRYTREAQHILREMDILHCHHLLMSVDLAHRYAHCPIVYTNHTRYDLYSGQYIPLPQPATDALVRQLWPEYTDLADVVVTPSESVRQVMLAYDVRRPIVVIENGVDLRPFHHPAKPLTPADLGIPAEATVLIYVGRLSAEKNLNVLLEQFAIAHDLLPHLHLLVVGTGPAANELPGYARDLGIDAAVHFAGPISYAEIPNVLSAAAMFVTASVSEVHPLTVIEALAAGLPVAASRSPGIVDTVESGKTGLLAANPQDGLAAAIVGLASNPERLRAMSYAAREASQKYDIRRTVAKTLELYTHLRETRPDLIRGRSHGRWYRGQSRFWPRWEQLSSLIRPSAVAPLSWFGYVPDEEKEKGETLHE